MADDLRIKRIKAAMFKIAFSLPDDAALGPIWERLVEMLAEARTGEQKRTEAQVSAAAWLAQNEIGASKLAMSASGNPAP